MIIPQFQKQKTITQEELNRQEAIEALRDLIAPAGLEINPGFLKLGTKYCATYFILTYPQFLASNWFSPIVNLDETLNISIFFHPIDNVFVLRDLRKKSAEVQAQLSLGAEKGEVRNPLLEIALQNIENLRDAIQQGNEKMFNLGVYITIFADNKEELQKIEKRIKNLFEQFLVYLKPAIFRQWEGLESIIPLGLDRLMLHTPLNSKPASTIFPFSSLDLSVNQGVLYGINRHNNSLIIFDRFDLENANMVVLGQSGSGKSYAVKLEILRSLLLGSDILIIDPENEYQYLAEALGGSHFKITVGSSDHINPFDLPPVKEDETNEAVFRSHILNLLGLFKIMLGSLTPEEEMLLDRAIIQTYALRDITIENMTWAKEMPIMEDLEEILKTIEGGEKLAAKLYKFTKGTYANFINQPSNIDIKNRVVIFSIKDLEEELRPLAMYLIINYLWTTIKKNIKKRLLIIDEGWWLLKHNESGAFVYGLFKRARKYYLGVSFITQDIEDMMNSPYGKPIITNSAMALILKQSSATIEITGKMFNFTEQEKALLLQAPVGTGLFFAGPKHVAIQVVASYAEDQIITSDPAQLMAIKKAKKELETLN